MGTKRLGKVFLAKENVQYFRWNI